MTWIRYSLYFTCMLGMFSSAVMAESRNCFFPGQLWPDDNGTHINAHGGGILFHQGRYYWFGEHKIKGNAGNYAHVGVHCYSSADLYNWKDEGISLSVSDDSKSDIAKGCILERPKVIYCAKTGKYVMYFHLELLGRKYSSARTGIAVADKVTGPFTFIKSLRPNAGYWPINVRPDQKDQRTIDEARAVGSKLSSEDAKKRTELNFLGAHFEGGQMSRDMTLFVDDDGKAYHLYASEHNGTLHIAELSDDYLGYSGKYVRVFEHSWTEAPAICRRNGKYYFLGSGCSGWAPNAARSAVADSIWGPWKKTGNPCIEINPESKLGQEKTFGGQSTYILPVQGKKDAFVAMFDMWRPDNAINGRYIWLPMDFDENGFKVKWQDKWDLGCFEKRSSRLRD